MKIEYKVHLPSHQHHLVEWPLFLENLPFDLQTFVSQIPVDIHV